MNMLKKEINSAQKREQILKVASSLIAKFGYSKITLDDIARVLKIKKTTLYYYYRNKDQIIEEVVRSEKSKYLKALQEHLAQKQETCAKIQEYIKTKLDYLKEALNLYDFSTSAFLELSIKIHSIIKETHAEEVKILTSIINDGITKKELVPCNATKIAESIVAISEAIKYKELYTANLPYMNDMDFDKVENDINYILGLVFEGLKPKKE